MNSPTTKPSSCYNECKNCWEENSKFWCKICQGGFCSEKCHKQYEESFYTTEYLSPHQSYNGVLTAS